MEQAEAVFRHFNTYFQSGGHDSFFDLWIDVLDGIELSGEPQNFASGGICCVDLIKCPTADRWEGVVRGPDKELIYNCFAADGSQRYLKRQVELHNPRVLIFSAGLGGGPRYYSENCLVNRDLHLRSLWPEHIRSICSGIWTAKSYEQAGTDRKTPGRLSIGLAKDNDVRSMKSDVKSAIRSVIRSWEGSCRD